MFDFIKQQIEDKHLSSLEEELDYFESQVCDCFHCNTGGGLPCIPQTLAEFAPFGE